MKKLFAILLLSWVALSASAQHSMGSHRAVRSHVSIGIGSPSYGYGNGYNRYYSPFNTFPSRSYNYNRPSQLDLNIQDIENEYRDRIWSVRHDKAISRQQRKENLRALRYEKEKAIIDARRGYYTKRY
jgi:hypothetical protein